MDCDFSFLEVEDFGLAKSFSTAPILSIAPLTNFAQKEQPSVESELELDHNNGLISEGFCFKMAPGQDVS